MTNRRFAINPEEAPLETLRRCGGFYECPKVDGKRTGPLVGYAGEYAPGMHFVGDVYANFAKAEEFPVVMESFCQRLKAVIPAEVLDSTGVYCAAPLGGMAAAYQLALLTDSQYVFAEKKVLKAAEGGEREKSELMFNRHEVTPGSRVAIVEDVTNNFSTTDSLIKLIHDSGADVTAIITLLNRSLEIENMYRSQFGGALPIVCLVRKAIMQYRQDDPEVISDVSAGNVVWKPKSGWKRLEAAMSPAD